MNAEQCKLNLSKAGIIAVVRADSSGEAVRAAQACIDGGITAIEITFTVQHADEVIKELCNLYLQQKEVIIGAGTILDAVSARIAILAGAQFIVGPCFDEATAKMCSLYRIAYVPGCMTITEMKQALEYGAQIIKLFPGSAFGPDFVKAVKAPLPQVEIIPTGGVNLDNVQQWIKNGCLAVGIGGNLLAPLKSGEYGKITAIAAQYVQKIRNIR